MASLSLFYRYNFARCSSELAELAPFPFSRGKSTRYSDRLHDFSVTIPRCYKYVYVNSFFPRAASFWNCLSIECFPLTYDLSGLSVFFLNRFPVCSIFFVFFFRVTPLPRSGCSALHGVNPN